MTILDGAPAARPAASFALVRPLDAGWELLRLPPGGPTTPAALKRRDGRAVLLIHTPDQLGKPAAFQLERQISHAHEGPQLAGEQDLHAARGPDHDRAVTQRAGELRA